LKKYVKYSLKGIAILLGIFLILYLVTFIYISTHKKAIIAQVTEEFGDRINGKVSIGNVELTFFNTFPKMSVSLGKVLVTDSLFPQHHHPFFTAENVFAQINILKVIQKKFPVNGLVIQNGAFNLFTDSSGFSNVYLLKPKSKSASVADSSDQAGLSSIILKNIRLTIDDQQKRKLHSILANHLNVKLNPSKTALTASVKADLMVHGLGFNLSRGSYIKDQTFNGNFNVRIDKQLNQLQFDSINFKIANQPFNATGRFDLQKINPQFALRIYAKNIAYSFAKSLLTDKIDSALSIVHLNKDLDADASIAGPLKGGQPLVRVNYKVKNSQLSTPFLNFQHASFTGYFSNEVKKGLPRLDPNSMININQFSARWNDLPVASKNIRITNLSKPQLQCDLQSHFKLKLLNDLIGSRSVKLKEGTGDIAVVYNGPLPKNNFSNSFISGVITFHNGTVLYTPRDVEMKNVNGKLILKNANVSVENLECKVFNNTFTMNGEAKNLLTLMNNRVNKASLDWNIYTPSLDLAAFTYLLKSQKKIEGTTGEKINNTASKIDAVLEQGIINVNLKTDELKYKKFQARDVTANVTLLEDRYLINNVSMKEGNGNININGSLINRKSNFHEVIFEATLSNVDVRKIFSSFNNFGQDGIEAQNIEGQLTSHVKATFGLNDNGIAYPGSVAGTVDFSLKNGALVNFEPIKKLQKGFFKKRDFNNVQFAELKNTLEIGNQEVKINRMEIESTVLSFFVEGTFSMKGNTDISIQLPLSNLKKRGPDYQPKNTGIDSNPGTSLYLRGRPGVDGKIQFKADIFNKFKKENKKGNAL
jgi:hypothetical protein